MLVIKSESPYLLAERQDVQYDNFATCFVSVQNIVSSLDGKTNYTFIHNKNNNNKKKKKSKTKRHRFTEPLNKINSLKVLNHLLGHHTTLCDLEFKKNSH